MRAALDWQLAPAPLISNEQFVLGGVGSIRGYREAEVLGDSGARLSLELGYKLPTGTDKIDWRVAAFLEGGYAWIESPLPEENRPSGWAAPAPTTRFDLYQDFYGQLDLAYQFRSDPTKSDSLSMDDLGGLRAHFKVGLKY